jgi:uncharacterized membrane protein
MENAPDERLWWRRSMPPLHPGRVNVGGVERLVSAVAGAGLIALGAVRRGPPRPLLIGLGALGVARGATGHSRLYQAAQVSSADLEHGAGVTIRESIVIAAPVSAVYAAWSDVTHLPAYLRFVREVVPLTEGVTHWVVALPAGGRTLEWDAEVIEQRPNEAVAWHTMPDSDVEHAGSVRFREIPGRGTELQVKLRFAPPLGAAGFAIARMLQRLEERGVNEELRRFKAVIETGEAPSTEGQPAGRPSARERITVATAPVTVGGDRLHVREEV